MPIMKWTKVDTGIYRHVPTNVVIVKVPAHREHGYAVGQRWQVRHPQRDGTSHAWTTRTLNDAKATAETHTIPGVYAAREAAHAEALAERDLLFGCLGGGGGESDERDAFLQNRAWVARHDLRSGRIEHVRPAVEADHAEALDMNRDRDALDSMIVEAVQGPDASGIATYRDGLRHSWTKTTLNGAKEIAETHTIPGLYAAREQARAEALDEAKYHQVLAWLNTRHVGLTPTPGTVARGVEKDHADAITEDMRRTVAKHETKSGLLKAIDYFNETADRIHATSTQRTLDVLHGEALRESTYRLYPCVVRYDYDEPFARVVSPRIAYAEARRAMQNFYATNTAAMNALHAEALREDWERRTVAAAGEDFDTHLAKFSGAVLPRQTHRPGLDAVLAPQLNR